MNDADRPGYLDPMGAPPEHEPQPAGGEAPVADTLDAALQEVLAQLNVEDLVYQARVDPAPFLALLARRLPPRAPPPPVYAQPSNIPMPPMETEAEWFARVQKTHFGDDPETQLRNPTPPTPLPQPAAFPTSAPKRGPEW